jgi:hypothetical protein
MALIHSPNIVTNGLLLYLDAPNPKSTTGTTWTDISGNNIPVTLQGGAETSSNVTNKSTYLNFDPSTYNADNSFYRITDSRVANLTTNVTLETCVYIHNVKPNDVNSNFRPVSPRLGGVVAPYGFGIIPNRNGRLGGITQEINTGPSFTWNTSEDFNVPTSIIDFNKWIYVTQVQDDTAKTLRTYVNGVLRTSLTYIGAPNIQGGFGGLDIGRGYFVTNQSFPGRIAFVRLYNRPLTAAEVTQNYNATQERFSREGLVIDSSLKLWIDADNKQSYQGTGTSIFDLSGNNRTQNLSNRLAYTVLSGGIKCWNCSDTHQINAAAISYALPATGYTYTIWARLKSSTSGFRTLIRTDLGLHPLLIDNANYNLGMWDGGQFRSTGYNVSALANTWVQWSITGTSSGQKYYINGVQVGSTTQTSVGGQLIAIGNWSGGQGFGHVAQVQAYERELGPHEILQNYNALKERFEPVVPVVDTSLKVLLDAGTSASYPGTGSTWTDLSGNGNNVTLFNSPTYSNLTTGVLTLNGTNQYAEGSVNFASSNQFTVSMWVMNTARAVSAGNDDGQIFSLGNEKLLFYTSESAGSTPWVFSVFSPTIFNNIARYSTTVMQLNTWYNLVGVYTGTSFEMFVNGQSILSTSANISNVSLTTETYQIGRRINNGNTNFAGNVSNLNIYNRALTSAEVRQNYNALRERFVPPPVIDSSLKLWLDASNPASYPGTGNTWTDLSGNGNNATLVVAPTYSSTGHFTFNGSTQYASIPSSASLTTTTPTIIIACTVAASGVGTVMSKGAFGQYWNYGLDDVGATTFKLRNNGGDAVSATYGTISGMNVFAGVWNGTNMSFYLNGNFIGQSNQFYSPIANNTGLLTIGCGLLQTTPTEFYAGNIAMIQVYNRALNAEEINQNYNSLRGRYGL